MNRLRAWLRRPTKLDSLIADHNQAESDRLWADFHATACACICHSVCSCDLGLSLASWPCYRHERHCDDCEAAS